MSLHRAATLVIWLALLFNAGMVVFHAIGIAYGGDCRPCRVVALFMAGAMGILVALLISSRERENREWGLTTADAYFDNRGQGW